MNTKEKFVITISREVGSGGRTVGRKLAEKLGVRYCDKQLIKKLTEMFGLNASEIESIKAKKKSWLEDLFSKITPEFGSEMFIPKGVEYAPEVTSGEIFNYESQATGGRVFLRDRRAFRFLRTERPSQQVRCVHPRLQAQPRQKDYAQAGTL